MFSKSDFIKSILLAIFGTIVLIFAGLLLFIRFGNPYGVLTALSGSTEPMTKFQTVLNTILENHIDKLDEDELIDGALSGMLNSVDDPYTYYLTAEQYDEMYSSKNPTFTGVGITVNRNEYNDKVLITAVNKGSNAYEVGIKEGDCIVAVNGTRVNADNKDILLDSVAGEEGTTVELTVLRGKEELIFVVERRVIRVELAVSHIYNNSIGYIRLRSFQAAAKEDFENCLSELLEQNITGLIIDLRGNGGGYKDVAIALVDHFIPKGIIYETKNNQGVIRSETSSGNMIDIPFAVLVNGSSASASELFAGAIQDYGTGTLIGSVTFGKGIVQYTRRLEDGSYFQYTAETWYTPNGNQIHGVGLTPDIEVEQSKDVDNYINQNPTLIPDVSYDKQLEKALEILS